MILSGVWWFEKKTGGRMMNVKNTGEKRVSKKEHLLLIFLFGRKHLYMNGVKHFSLFYFSLQ